MNDQKIVDCVQWKHDLYENAYKASGARNFAEYINIVNTAVHHTGRPLPEETVFQGTGALIVSYPPKYPAAI
ncbi:hypothetical protein AGMMS49942_22700 [Spirochaetia bacterium]|nr:hypothetical protein AGMMS49942_22700 [Spirochaetia bacterium]